MKILCKIGLHKWSKKKFKSYYGSNVKDWSRYCTRCGKKQTWTETIDKKAIYRGE